MSIQSFKCRDTQALFEAGKSKQFSGIQSTATRKLTMIEAAVKLDDLRSPPGNRLEALAGNRAGQYSVRINDKWRICFQWTDAGPTDVEITNHYA